MAATSTQQQISDLLGASLVLGGYPSALVCTDDGLVVAAAGEPSRVDDTAAVASLFDAILERAKRDLGFSAVDEVSLLDPKWGRTVIRPLAIGSATMFLVVRVPAHTSWRRNTNDLCKRLVPALTVLAGADDAE